MGCGSSGAVLSPGAAEPALKTSLSKIGSSPGSAGTRKVDLDKVRPRGGHRIPRSKRRKESQLFLAWAPHGTRAANELIAGLQKRLKRGHSIFTLPRPTELELSNQPHLVDYTALVERKVAACEHFIAIITEDAMRDFAVLFALRCSVSYRKQLALVHEPGEPLPDRRLQPPDLADAGIFVNTEVVLVPDRIDLCVEQLAEKFNVYRAPSGPGPRVQKTRAFIVHCGGDITTIALAIQVSLKKDFSVYVADESTSDPIEAGLTLQQTQCMVCLLSENVLQSDWCIGYLRDAIRMGKPVHIVQDQRYTLPTEFPVELTDIQLHVEKNPIIYVAGFHDDVVQALKNRIGPSDRAVKRMGKLVGRPLMKRLELKDTTLDCLDWSDRNIIMKGQLEAHFQIILHVYRFPPEQIVRMNFSTAMLRLSDVESLCRHIPSFPFLHTLNLSFCGIGDQCAVHLADALKTNITITYLELESNDILNRGAIALADMFKANQTLARLNLRQNEGASWIGEAMKANRTLTDLDVGNSPIWNDGGAAFFFVEALKSNTGITTLIMDSSSIAEKYGCSLAQALKVNETLTSLTLRDNQLGDKAAQMFAEALLTNRSVTYLNLENNQISEAGVHLLSDAHRARPFALRMRGNPGVQPEVHPDLCAFSETESDRDDVSSTSIGEFDESEDFNDEDDPDPDETHYF